MKIRRNGINHFHHPASQGLGPGTSVGPHQIDSPVGVGRMSNVHQATDTRLGRTVAIKVPPEHVASHPDL